MTDVKCPLKLCGWGFLRKGLDAYHPAAWEFGLAEINLVDYFVVPASVDRYKKMNIYVTMTIEPFAQESPVHSQVVADAVREMLAREDSVDSETCRYCG